MRKYLVIIILFYAYLLNGAKQIELTNAFIKIMGDEKTGRFIIQAKEGDPELATDQNSYLLYQDKVPTSFTTLRLDGINYRFGSSAGVFIQKMRKEENILRCHWRIKKIDMIQELKIVRGMNTGHLDTVDISYEIINSDHQEHSIGERIMLDTYLGKEDGAPFRLPNLGPIVSETLFQGEELPDYWYVYDKLIDSRVRAQGIIKHKNFVLPDKLIFSSWIRFDENDWYFPIEDGRSFARTPLGPKDSAVALYWDARKYNPGERHRIKTMYGIYGVSSAQGKIFNITLSGPHFVPQDIFFLTAEVENTREQKVDKVKVALVLPTGLNLSVDEKAEKEIGILNPHEIKHISWKVLPGLIEEMDRIYKVHVSGRLKEREERGCAERKIKKLFGQEKLVSELVDKNIEVQEKDKEIIIEFNDVMFKFNSSELTSDARKRLDIIGSILLQNKSFRVNIYGHTDNIGTQEYNQKLSETRAQSVLDYLIMGHYLKKNQGISKGFGKLKPIVANTTDEGRKRNRRVEVVIIPMK